LIPWEYEIAPIDDIPEENTGFVACVVGECIVNVMWYDEDHTETEEPGDECECLDVEW